MEPQQRTTADGRDPSGSWANSAENLGHWIRDGNDNHAANRNDNLGFRVLLSPANTPAASRRAGRHRAPSRRRSVLARPFS
ncbi:MAG: hypothetical protein AAF628_23740 [Planctomycetota bacterium]